MSEVQKVTRKCPCGNRFQVRAYQRGVVCPKCKNTVGRDMDRHSGAGLFLRMTEVEKDRLERIAFDLHRTQADLMREAFELVMKKYA